MQTKTRRIKLTDVVLLVLLIFFACGAAAGKLVPLFGMQLNLAKLDSSQPVVAIIIDDLGYAYYAGKRCVEMPADITLSIIPFTPHGKRLAEAAHAAGKEVMLHAPMETLHQGVWEPSLDLEMDQHEILANLGTMIQSVPYIKGLNNHGGSRLTQDSTRMRWLMSALAKADLYFVDSRTTAQSVALAVAREQQVPSAERDIFLDNDRDAIAIDEQLEKLKGMALANGQALAIGHPHFETLDAINRYIPILEAAGIRVVPVSIYLSRKLLIQLAVTQSLTPH